MEGIEFHLSDDKNIFHYISQYDISSGILTKNVIFRDFEFANLEVIIKPLTQGIQLLF